MSKLNDMQVIDRVLEGDTEIFSELIKRYQNMVFKYVYTQFNNYDDALDITQEIFIMSLTSLRSFRRESKFSTWLYSIMVNYCKNYRKKLSRQNYVSLNVSKGDDEFDLQLPDKREAPEDKVIQNDTLRIVKEEINSLPDDYRDILLLREIEGFSYNEIADILKIKLSNVKVRIHRGRDLLKNRLYGRGLI